MPRGATLLAVVASFLAGVALIHGAPSRWHLDPWQGVLLGAALYMGVFHRWLAWRESAVRPMGWAAAWSLAWRTGGFLGLVAVQAYAYFEWLPASDLRAPFVMLSGWVTAETLLAPRAIPSGLSAPSRRA